MDNKSGLILVFVFVTVFVYSTDGCCCGWPNKIRFKHSCYFPIINRNGTWQDAENYCETRYGHLVVIDDAEEQKFLNDFFRNNTATYKSALSFWTSGTKANYGRWYWHWSGKTMSYTNWATHQPDNHGGHEDCMEYGPKRGLKWTDNICSVHNNFLCEKE